MSEASVVPVIFSDQIWLRVHICSKLKVALLLCRQVRRSRSQSLTAIQPSEHGDPFMLQALLQRGVAQALAHARNISMDRNQCHARASALRNVRVTLS
jgi:hypothetical protein